jgi:hypothetical protein
MTTTLSTVERYAREYQKSGAYWSRKARHYSAIGVSTKPEFKKWNDCHNLAEQHYRMARNFTLEAVKMRAEDLAPYSVFKVSQSGPGLSLVKDFGSFSEIGAAVTFLRDHPARVRFWETDKEHDAADVLMADGTQYAIQKRRP